MSKEAVFTIEAASGAYEVLAQPPQATAQALAHSRSCAKTLSQAAAREEGPSAVHTAGEASKESCASGLGDLGDMPICWSSEALGAHTGSKMREWPSTG